MLAVWSNPRTGTFCASEASAPPKVNRGSAAIYRSASRWTDRYYSIGPLAGPFCFLDFASCDFYQVSAVIPRRVNTDSAGLDGPSDTTTSRAYYYPVSKVVIHWQAQTFTHPIFTLRPPNVRPSYGFGPNTI